MLVWDMIHGTTGSLVKYTTFYTALSYSLQEPMKTGLDAFRDTLY